MMNKFNVQSSGRTAYELITHRKCKHDIIGFAEVVLFQTTMEKTNRDKINSDWDRGVFLGVCWRTTEYIVGTKEGLFKCRTVRRVVEDKSYDPDCLDYVKEFYDDYMLKGASTTAARVRFGIAQRQEPGVEGVRTAGGDYAPRRLRLVPQDFVSHGYTEGCGGCTWLQTGLGNRRGHNEECRTRLELELQNDDSGELRVRKNKERTDGWMAETIQKGDNAATVPGTPIGAPKVSSDTGDGEIYIYLYDPLEEILRPDDGPTTEWFDIYDDDMSPITPEPDDLEDVPHRGTETRATSPDKASRERLVDGPAAKGDVRVHSPQRRPAVRRSGPDTASANTEPNTKVIIRDDGSDDDIDFGPEHGPFIKAPFVNPLRTGAHLKTGQSSFETHMASRRDSMPMPSSNKIEDVPIKFDSRIAMMGILNRSMTEILSPDSIRQLEAQAAVVSSIYGVAIAEVYLPWRVNNMCDEMGLTPGCAMDVRNGFDFDTYADRKRASQWIDDNDPDLVIGSPPCTYFSRLQELCKHMFKDDPEWQRRFQENLEGAKRHVRFCCQLYEKQRARGTNISPRTPVVGDILGPGVRPENDQP